MPYCTPYIFLGGVAPPIEMGGVTELQKKVRGHLATPQYFTSVIIPFIILKMKMPQREYLRSVIFGVEDSLVSTTGLIAGLSVGADNKRIVLLGGLVAIIVEAVSMGAGEYLSDDAVSELDKIKRHKERPLISGFLMLVSYFLAGMVPLLPVIFINYPKSLWFSVGLAFAGLFLLGYLKSKLLGTSALRGGFKILIIGGIATAFGVVVGSIFKLGVGL